MFYRRKYLASSSCRCFSARSFYFLCWLTYKHWNCWIHMMMMTLSFALLRFRLARERKSLRTGYTTATIDSYCGWWLERRRRRRAPLRRLAYSIQPVNGEEKSGCYKFEFEWGKKHDTTGVYYWSPAREIVEFHTVCRRSTWRWRFCSLFLSSCFVEGARETSSPPVARSRASKAFNILIFVRCWIRICLLYYFDIKFHDKKAGGWDDNGAKRKNRWQVRLSVVFIVARASFELEKSLVTVVCISHWSAKASQWESRAFTLTISPPPADRYPGKSLDYVGVVMHGKTKNNSTFKSNTSGRERYANEEIGNRWRSRRHWQEG